MKSRVAEESRRAQAEAEAALSISERVALLARANELAVELYAAANAVTRDEARRILGQRADEQ